MELSRNIGRYQLVECVARGGMGTLYRARDPVLERDVAIKVMLADFSHDAVGRARFYREARAVARLQHRNIVTLFDFGEEDGNPFIVMEYLQGQTLAARLRHGPPLPLDEALGVGAQLCTGLHFAHMQGVVHRDVKPANIWLLDDGGVKLLDFGIAKFGDGDVTRTGDVVGSISYMSPEQLSGGAIDARSDVFSTGVVMFELLAGRKPFQADSPTAIMMQIMYEAAPPLDVVPGAPPKLRALIARSLDKKPEGRFPHAAEFASELRDLQMQVERQRGSITLSESSETIAQELAVIQAGTSAARTAVPRVQPLVSAGEPSVTSRVADRPHDHDHDPVGNALIDTGTPKLAPDRAAAAAARRRWLPVAAGVGVVVLTVVTFLLARGESTGVGRTPPPIEASAANTSARGGAKPSVPAKRDAAPGPGAGTTPSPGPVPPPSPAAPAPPGPPAPAVVAPAAADANALRVTLTGSYPFDVIGDDGLVSRRRTRHELTLAGPQALRLRSTEYGLDRSIKVTGKPGTPVALQAPALGRLTVRTTHETCQVRLGGLTLGYPPIHERQVASGTYKLTLSCPDGDNQTSTVTVDAGRTSVALIQ